jgi:hypothetical protein
MVYVNKNIGATEILGDVVVYTYIGNVVYIAYDVDNGNTLAVRPKDDSVEYTKI